MSGRGERSNSRGGRNRSGRGGRVQNYVGAAKTTKTDLCLGLGTNVFDHGPKNSPDLVNTSLEKIVQHAVMQRAQCIVLEKAASDKKDGEALIKLAVLQNDIAMGELEANEDVPILLTDEEKRLLSGEWRTHSD